MVSKFLICIGLIIFATAANALLAATANAYLLSSQTIAARVGKTRGKGAYVVDQDVIFKTATDTISLREHWVVDNAEHMRLRVLAPKIAGGTPETLVYEALYHNGNRSALGDNGNVQSTVAPREFLEPVFYARTAKTFLDYLAHSGAVPGSFLRGRARFQAKADADADRPHEAMVRLARSNGLVTYAFGEPTPVNAAKANPGAWIEQDSFYLRRLRFPSGDEVSVERYSTSEGGLRFPLERTVSFGTNTALIHLISAKSIQPATVDKVLSTNVDADRQDRLPDNESVKEFYSRFR